MLGQGVDDERPVTVRFTPVAGGTPSSASATSTGGSWSATVPLGLSPGRYEITAAQGGHEGRVLTSVVAPDIALSASVAGAGSAASEAALPGDVVIAGQAIPTSATAPVAIVDGLVDGDRLGTDPTQAQLASVFRGLSVGRTSPTMLVPADDLGRWEGVLRVPASAAGRHVIKVTQDVPGLRQRTTYLQLTVMASTTTTSGPVVAPSAPGVPSVVAGAGRAVVRWKTPAAGSSPIAGYEVWAVDDRSKSCSVSVGASTHANRCIVRDLAQGTPYRFKVSALSAAGRSRGSAPSAPITPKGPPGVPLAPSAVAGKGSAKVSWKAPSSNGSPITAYTVTASPGGATCTTAGGSSSCKVLLTNGTAYSFTVAATNALGTSISPASTPVTPVAAPEAPSAPSVQPGSRSAVVSWSEPSSNGSPITGYAVVAKPGGKRCSTSSTTTCTITGLTNGTAYTFTVAATNALGTSTSPASSPSIPAAVPDTPTSPVATGAVGGTPARPSITVSWTAPGADGGSAVTSYVATAVQDQSKTCTAQAPSTSCTITSLPTGLTYAFTVVAVNAMGSSLPSAATAPITTASKPGAPTNVVATGGDTTVSVTWTPPVNGGGTPITSYVVKQVYTSNTCVYVVGSTPANTCTFTGLANGRWMQFTVAAVNAMGTSFDSQMSLYVTVGQGPSAPTNLVATPGNGSVVLTWDAPTAPGSKYNATSPGQRGTVTGYHVSLASGGYAYGCYVYGSGATPPPRTCTITGLRNGTSYQFVVTASNDSSAVSDASIPSDAVVPATPPSAPTGLVALASRTTAALRWSAPADTGGAPITSYVATFRPSNGASFTATFDGTATSGMVTGLTPEVTYVVTIKAVTRVGASPDSTSSTALWTERPAVPRDVTVQAQPGSAVISWTQPPSMTFPIVSYTITAIDRTDPAGSTTAVVSTNPGGIGGLVPGDTYAFTVAATNIVGTSAASSPSSAVSFAVPPAPAAASAFLYDYEPPAGEVEVTWTAPDTTGFLPITGYRITAKAPTGDPVTVEADAASTSASISGLDPWTPYAIWVSALSATGSSELASAGVVTPPGPPRKPSGFTASSEGYNLHFGFDPTGQGTDPVGTFSIVSDLGFRCWNISTSTCDAVTAYGLTQSWALVARNAWGSTSSDPVVVTPEPYGPSVPLVDPVRALDGSAAISWTAPGDFVLWDFPVGTPTWPRSFTARVVGDPSHACTVEAGQYERRYRCTIDGLTVGATYRFEVVATNEYGDATSPALTAVVKDTPTAPEVTSVSVGDGRLSVAYVPADAPVSAIRTHTLSATAPDGSVHTSSCASSPCTIDGLDDGVPYTVLVTATTTLGVTGPSSTPRTEVPVAAPAPVTGLRVVTASDAALDLGFSVTQSTAAPVSSYRTSAVDLDDPTGSRVAICPASTGPIDSDRCRVDGLVNGHRYSVSVTALGAGGSSQASTLDGEAVPSDVPTAPVVDDSQAAAASITVSFHGSSARGSAITGFEARIEDLTVGSIAVAAIDASPAVVAGLTNGHRYQIEVRAQNARGHSDWSAPGAEVVPFDVPATPGEVVATKGDASATLSLTAPAARGSSIIAYAVSVRDLNTASSAGEQVVGTSLPLRVSGLVNGHLYTFTVSAINAAGRSLPSPMTSAVTPSGPPGAPLIEQDLVRIEDGGATIWFSRGPDGGARIDRYTATAVDVATGASTVAVSTSRTYFSSLEITGLTNGHRYALTMTQTTSEGTSPASSPTLIVRPVGPPPAPIDVHATLSQAAITVSWSEPENTSGSPITGYTATAAGLRRSCISNGPLSCTIVGAGSVVADTVTVVARNAAATSAPSVAVSTMAGEGPASRRPSSPLSLALAGVGEQILATWSPPADTGGGVITGYVVTLEPGGQTCTTVSSLSCWFSQIDPYAIYTATAVAINSAGTSTASDPSAEGSACGLVASSCVGWLSAGNTPDGVEAAEVRGGIRVTWHPHGPAAQLQAIAAPSGRSCSTTLSTADGSGRVSCLIPGDPGSFDHREVVHAVTVFYAGAGGVVSSTSVHPTFWPTASVSVPALTNAAAPEVTGTVGGGSSSVTVVAAPSSCASAFDCSDTSSWSAAVIDGRFALALTGIADGSYTVFVDGFDPSAAPPTMVVDTTAPTPLTIGAPLGVPSTIVEPSAAVAGTAECNPSTSLSVAWIAEGDPSGTPLAVSSPARSDGPTCSYLSLEPQLTDGRYVVRATMTDAAGNTSSAETTATVDSQSPSPHFSAPVAGADVAGGMVAVSGTSPAHVGDVARVLLSATRGAQTISKVIEVVDGGFSTLVPLDPGAWALSLRQVDVAGNAGTDVMSITVSAPPGRPSIVVPAQGASVAATTVVAGWAQPGATVDIAVAGSRSTSTVAGVDGWWQVTQSMGAGARTIEAASNGERASTQVTVGSPTPTLSIAPVGRGGWYSSAPILGTGTPGSSVSVSVDDVVASVAVAESGIWSFDTTGLAQGAHQVSATDGTSTAQTSIVIDRNPPVVGLVDPATPWSSTRSVTLSTPSSAGDCASIRVSYSAGGSLLETHLVAATGTTATDLLPSAAVDGPITVQASRCDAAGNVGSVEATYRLDTSAPRLSSNLAALMAGPLTITGTAGAAPGDQAPVVTVDGVPTTPATGDHGGFSVATVITAGIHQVSIDQLDAAGNLSHLAHDVLVLSSPPDLSLDLEGRSAVTDLVVSGSAAGDGGPVTITAVPDDPTQPSVTLSATPIAGRYSATPLAAVPSPGGWWTVSVTRHDAVGNEARRSVHVLVDPSAPSLHLDVAVGLHGSAWFSSTTPTITGTASSEAWRAPVVLRVTSVWGETVATVTAVPVDGRFTAQLPPLEEGYFELAASLDDPLHPIHFDDRSSVPFRIDLTPPFIRMDQTSDTVEQWCGFAIPTSSDVPVVDVTYLRSDRTIAEVDHVDTDWIGSFCTAPGRSGTYDVVVSRTDAAGNVGSVTRSRLAFDLEAPVVSVDTSSFTDDGSLGPPAPALVTGRAGTLGGDASSVTVTFDRQGCSGDGCRWSTSVPVAADGTWSLAPRVMTAGIWILREVTQSDAAGHRGRFAPSAPQADAYRLTVNARPDPSTFVVGDSGRSLPSTSLTVGVCRASADIPVTLSVGIARESAPGTELYRIPVGTTSSVACVSRRIINFGELVGLPGSPAIINGRYRLVATVSDAQGNTTETTTSYTSRYTAPRPTITGLTSGASDAVSTSASLGDGPILHGTGWVNDFDPRTIEVYVAPATPFPGYSNSTSLRLTTTVQPDGTWSIALPSTVPLGPIDVRVHQGSGGAGGTFSLSGATPTVDAVTMQAATTPSGTRQVLTFSGALPGDRAVSGGTVSIVSPSLTNPVVCDAITMAGGRWTCTAVGEFSDGVYTAVVTTTTNVAYSTCDPFEVGDGTFGCQWGELRARQPSSSVPFVSTALKGSIPVPVITAPLPGTVAASTGTIRPLSGPVTVRGIASNAPGDLPSVSIKVFAGSAASGKAVQTLTAVASASTSVFTKVVTLPDGTWTIQATQADSSGNKGMSSAVTVVEDSTPPTLSTTWPTASGAVVARAAIYGSLVGGTGTFGVNDRLTPSGTSTSGSAVQVANQTTSTGTIRYYSGTSATGSPVLTDTITTNPDRLVPAPASTFVDAPDLPAGTYTAVITASDLAQNTISRTLGFTVAPAAGPTQTPAITASVVDSQGAASVVSGSTRLAAGIEEITIVAQCPLGVGACPQPSGTVRLLDNGSPISNETVLSGARAVVNVTFHVGSGPHALSVAFGGDSTYRPGTTAVLGTLSADPIVVSSTVLTPTAPQGAASLSDLSVERRYQTFSQRVGGERRSVTATCPSSATTVSDAGGTVIFSGPGTSGPVRERAAAGTQAMLVVSAAAGDCAASSSSVSVTLPPSKVGTVTVRDPNAPRQVAGGEVADPVSAVVVGRDVALTVRLDAPSNAWLLQDSPLTDIPVWLVGPDGSRIESSKTLVSFDARGGITAGGTWGLLPATATVHVTPDTAGLRVVTVVAGGGRSGYEEVRGSVTLAVEPAPLSMAMSFSPTISHPGQAQAAVLRVGGQASSGRLSVAVPGSRGGSTTLAPTLSCTTAGCSAPIDLSSSLGATASASLVSDFTSSATGRTYRITTALPRAPWTPALEVVAGAGSPRGLRATPTADHAETIDWVAPATNGATITGYVVTTDIGPGCSAGPTERSCTVTGLTDDQMTTFSVRTVSTAGTSAAATIHAAASSRTLAMTPNPTSAATAGTAPRDQLLPVTVTLAFDPAMAAELRSGELRLVSKPWTSTNPYSGCGNGIPDAFCNGTSDQTTVDLNTGEVHRSLRIRNRSLAAMPKASLDAAGTSSEALTSTAEVTWSGSVLTLRTQVYVGGGPFDVDAQFVPFPSEAVAAVSTASTTVDGQPSTPRTVRVVGVGSPVLSIGVASAVVAGGYYGPRAGSNGPMRTLSFSPWGTRNPQVGEIAYVKAQADPYFTAPSDRQVGLALAEAVPMQAPVFAPPSFPYNQMGSGVTVKRLGSESSYDGLVSCDDCAIWTVRNLDPTGVDPGTGAGLEAGTSAMGVVAYGPGTSSVTAGTSQELASRVGLTAFTMVVNPVPTVQTAVASRTGATVNVLTAARWPGMAPGVQTSLGTVAVSVTLKHGDTSTMIGYCFYSGVCLDSDGNGQTFLPATVVPIGARLSISIDTTSLGFTLGASDTVTVTTSTPWGVDATSSDLALAAPTLSAVTGGTGALTGTGAWLGATPLSPNVSAPWPFLGWSVYNGAHDFFVSLFGDGKATRFLMGLTGFLWSSAIEWVATGGPFNPIADLEIVQVLQTAASDAIAASRLGRLAAKAEGLGIALTTWAANKLPARVRTVLAKEAGPVSLAMASFAKTVGGYAFSYYASDWVSARTSAALSTIGVDPSTLSSIRDSVTSSLSSPLGTLDPAFTQNPVENQQLLDVVRDASDPSAAEALGRFNDAIRSAYASAAGDASSLVEDVGYGRGVAIEFSQIFSASIGVTLPASGSFDPQASTLTISTTRDPFDPRYDNASSAPVGIDTAPLGTCTIAGDCTMERGLEATVFQGRVVVAGQFPSKIAWAPSGAWLVLKLNLVARGGGQGPVLWNRVNIPFQGQQYDCWGAVAALPYRSDAAGNKQQLCENIAGAQRSAGVRWRNDRWQPTGLLPWNPNPSFDPTRSANQTTQVLTGAL